MEYLRLLRIGFASVVLLVCVLAPRARGVSVSAVVVATAAYLLLVPVPELTRRLRRTNLLPVIGGTLLVDGIYLAWASYATGGAQSPLRFLVFVHVVAVTLLASSRTGLPPRLDAQHCRPVGRGPRHGHVLRSERARAPGPEDRPRASVRDRVG